MSKPPPKTKPIEAWTVADHVEHKRSGVEPVSDEWKDYVRDVAEAAGVAPGDLGLDGREDFDPETATVEQHYNRIRRDR